MTNVQFQNTFKHCIYIQSLTHHEGKEPTDGAGGVKVAGWVNGEIWVEVRMLDKQRQGRVQATERKWNAVVASGPGISHTATACASASTESQQREKLDLKYHHLLTVYSLTHSLEGLGMNIDKC